MTLMKIHYTCEATIVPSIGLDDGGDYVAFSFFLAFNPSRSPLLSLAGGEKFPYLPRNVCIGNTVIICNYHHSKHLLLRVRFTCN